MNYSKETKGLSFWSRSQPSLTVFYRFFGRRSLVGCRLIFRLFGLDGLFKQDLRETLYANLQRPPPASVTPK